MAANYPIRKSLCKPLLGMMRLVFPPATRSSIASRMSHTCRVPAEVISPGSNEVAWDIGGASQREDDLLGLDCPPQPSFSAPTLSQTKDPLGGLDLI
jgi:hypothetical protein